MYDRVIVKFKEEDLMYRGEMDVLTEGVCEGILPISIVKKDKEVTGFYITTGYRRLACMHDVSAYQALTVMEKTIEAMEECRRYLIFPEEFIISPDTAYIDGNFEKVKFTYVPDKSSAGARKKLIRFTQDLKMHTTVNGKLYLEMLCQLLSAENLNVLMINNFINRLKREVIMCRIV